MAAAAVNKIEMAHQIYRDGKYEEALGFYTEALSVAKTKAQKIALHSNRAACYLKLHEFKQAAEECTSVLELDNKHAGALMLRAQTLVTLKEYHSALFDVNRLMELNPSSEVYRNLETRLRTQLSLAPIPESEAELEEEEEEEEDDDDEGEECRHEEEEEENCEENTAMAFAETNQKTEPYRTAGAEFAAPKAANVNGSPEINREPRKTIAAEVIAQAQKKVEPRKTLAAEVIAQARRKKESPEPQSKGWQTIPKPKGHSALDYARWDNVEDDSSEDDEDDDDEEEPQYRFRVKTVGVRSVK